MSMPLLTELKTEIDKPTVMVGDLKILLSVTDGKRKQKTTENIDALKVLSVALTSSALYKQYIPQPWRHILF